MIVQINERLAPADQFAMEGGNVSTWQMNEATVQMMLRGLFARFLLMLGKPDGRKNLVSQFGEGEISAVEGLLKSLRGIA